MRKFAVFFISLTLAGNAVADAPADIYTRINAARHERNYLAAIAEFRTLQKLEPILFSANNYDYLLARIAEQSGDFPLAMTNYQAVIFRKSVLREYALWHMSQIAMTTGNLTLERLYLIELETLFPESLLSYAAMNRSARSLFESYEFGRMLAESRSGYAILSDKSDTGPQATKSRIELSNDVLIGKAYMYSGEPEKARQIFDRLITESDLADPDDFAFEAARGLDLLDGGTENFGRIVPYLSDTDHKRRADIYQFNREFELARLHFRAIADRHSSSGFVPDAIFGIGRSYARQGNFVEAINWFERLFEQYPQHELASEGLLQAASAYARVGKFREAVSRYQRFVEKYPNDDRVGRANLNAAAVLRDHNEDTEALRFAASAAASEHDTDAARGIFTEARIFASRENWEKEIGAIERLSQLPVDASSQLPDGTNLRETAFLRGFVLEQLRRYGEAIDTYLSIPDGRDEYYGGLATERLRTLADKPESEQYISARRNDLIAKAATRDAEIRRQSLQGRLRLEPSAEGREKLLAGLRKVYSEIPAYSKLPMLKSAAIGRKEILKAERHARPANRHAALAGELAFLALFDEAVPEFEASRSASDTVRQAAADSKILYVYILGNSPGKAVSQMVLNWQKVPVDFQIELLPADVVRALFPAPFADDVLRYSRRYGIDPRFVLAVMRQESRFRPDARSNASARGLMQFITDTAAKIAGETGRASFRPDDLFDPGTSILFGSKYISNLFKLFPNQPEAVAAAYNGGEDNMKRWVGRANSRIPERYVPEIAFGQTKEYVYKVMSNYRIYQAFYDENLNLK